MDSVLSGLRARTPDMVEMLGSLVGAESPSADGDATRRCAELLAELGARLLGAAPELRVVDGRTHVLWAFGPPPRVLLLGHLDTVWPAGTIRRWPFAVHRDRATGPGVFDMKAGIVQGLHALAALPDLTGTAMLVTSDEEIGARTSRELIEAEGRNAAAVLVLEPAGPGGALKTARKGVAGVEVHMTGVAAHAGLDPGKGVNALAEAARVIACCEGIGRPDAGTTVTPTVLHAGTAENTVPADALLKIDVRARTMDEQSRVLDELARLQPSDPGARISVGVRHQRPPLERRVAAELYDIAAGCARRIGLQVPRDVEVGGGSDGNFTAALGIPTLDGLGAVGDGAHAEGEHVRVPAMPERAALVAALVMQLRREAPRDVGAGA